MTEGGQGPAETAKEAVDRTNRDLFRFVRICGLLALAMLAAVLVWFVLYVMSNHSVNCQTNSLVRQLYDLVNNLLAAVHAHTHYRPPGQLRVPTGCQ